MHAVEKTLMGISSIALFCLIAIIIFFSEPDGRGKTKEVSMMAEEVRNVCADDIDKFCKAGAVHGTIPGCLWDNRGLLSVECADTLRKAHRRRD
jgi:hypothetical protein